MRHTLVRARILMAASGLAFAATTRATAQAPFPGNPSGVVLATVPEPSGITWCPARGGYLVLSDQGVLYLVDAAGIRDTWTIGGDTEGICLSPHSSDLVYITEERLDQVWEYSLSQRAIVRRFQMLVPDHLPPHGLNDGVEGLATLPDPDPNHVRLLCGLQQDGQIYVVRIPAAGPSTSVQRLGVIRTRFSGVNGLDYDPDLGLIYAISDSGRLLALTPDGTERHFWTVPGSDPEGCSAVGCSLAVTEDSSGRVVRYPAFPSLAPCAAGRADRVRQVAGVTQGQRLGEAVSAAGDFNRDGYADFAVGSSGSVSGGQLTGHVAVTSGRDGRVLWQTAGSPTLGVLGSILGDARDLDRDGFGDLVAGAPAAGAGGVVTVLAGPNGRLLGQFTGLELGSGQGAVGLGDVNGDGFRELAIATPFASPGGVARAGSVLIYTFSGQGWRLLARMDGSVPDEQLGIAVAAAGDLDHDGRDDLIVGSNASPGSVPGAGSAIAFGYDGQQWHSLLRFDGTTNGAAAGASVAGAGDVDGDRHADVIVGVPGGQVAGVGAAGFAVVLSGRNGRVIWRLDGSAVAGAFGASVAGLGDANGDGVPDLAVGVPGDNAPFPGAGSVRGYSGRTGQLLFRVNGSRSGEGHGHAVAGPGDTDRNGRSDLLVGVPGAQSSATETGMAEVLTLGDPVASSTVRGGGLNPQLYRSTCNPVSGARWLSSIALAAGSAATLVGIGTAPTSVAVPGGELLIGGDLVFLVSAGSAIGNHALDIPLAPPLLGVRLYTQALVVEANGVFRLTNAVDLVLGSGGG